MNRQFWTVVVFFGTALAWCPSAPLGADEKKPATTDRAETDIFQPTKVWQIHLTLAAKEFEAIQPVNRGRFPGFGFLTPKPAEKPADPNREVHRNTFGMDLAWAVGSVAVDGQTFEGVGIRYKGNGTISDASQSIKKSFKIDLDHFGKTARFHGRKTLNLHCGVADPSKCRETLGYELYRAAGVPAPRTTLAEVWLTVPGKYDKLLLGAYTLVEHADKTFLHDFFGTDKGLLLKPEGVRDFTDLGDDWARYDKQYEPKRPPTKEEAARVVAFARLVSKAKDEEFRRDIDSYLDVDSYLRFLAVTSFIANSDSFFALGHNYHLHLHPQTGKFHFIPWDLDRSFANLPIFGSNNKQMDLSFTHPYAGPHKLTDRLLAVPKVSEQYQKLLGELAATCLAKERLLKAVASAENATKELVARDAKAAEVRKDGIGGFGPLMMFGRPPTLTTFVEKRTASLTAQLAGKSKGHVPSIGFGPGAFKMGDFLGEPMLETFDTAKDGRLSKDEWVAVAKKLFDASAKDSQGRVNEKGVAEGVNGMFPKPPAGSPAAPPGGFSMGSFMAGPIVKRADADEDGKLTLDELVTTAEKLFDEFDKGKTGNLDETTFCDLLNALFPAPNFAPPPRRPEEPKKDEKKP